MRASDVMTTDVITVPVDARIVDVADILTRHRIAAAPVLDAEGRLIGIVSESDLIDQAVFPDPRAHMWRTERPGTVTPVPATVAEVMTSTVVAMPPTTDLADLADTMVTLGIRSIPIVLGSRVIGIVSRRDLLRTLVRTSPDHRGGHRVRTDLSR